ncbi:helix-turn-helix domain-containing protein [Arthrobacter sp. NPDC056886]|uniref:helix-turn-helix domain-containing protein n=1 Tax=Arthrobacter sp. NPDC056886 TaxID=3345960 RepID=UPI00366EAC6D
MSALSMLPSPSPMSEIARQVRDARAARGWSQHELAEHAGVSRPTVARVEAGDDVNTAKLMRIAEALGLVLRIDRQEVPWDE